MGTEVWDFSVLTEFKFEIRTLSTSRTLTMTKKLPTKPKQLAYLHRKIRTSYRGRGSYNRFAKEHSCSPHTAKKWIDKALSTTYSANFKFVNGRPAYLNSESKDFLMEQITKKGLMGNAISSKQYHINSTTALTLVEEASQRQRETDPNRLTKSLTADQAKFQLKQAGAYTKSAQETTPDHYLHLNCIYNCVIMVITAIFLLKYLPHWGLFFNLDATGFDFNKIGDKHSLQVWTSDELQKKLQKRNLPLGTLPDDLGGTGVFCKHMTLVSGLGMVAPFVFSVADKTMPPGKTEFILVKGLNQYSDMSKDGWICIHNTAAGTDMFYERFYAEIFIPFVQECRTNLNLPPDAPAVLWVDGEAKQINPLKNSGLVELFKQNNILVLKGPAGTTPRSQLLDVSVCFKMAHAISCRLEAIAMWVKCNTLFVENLEKKLEEYRNVQVAQKRTKWETRRTEFIKRMIVGAAHGLRESLTAVHIVKGLENTGVYKAGEGSKKAGYDILKIFQNFNQTVTIDQETTVIIEATKLADDLAKNGTVTDGQLETMEIVKYMLLKEMAKQPKNARDTLHIRSQRTVLLTHVHSLKKLNNYKTVATTNREIAAEKKAAKALAKKEEEEAKKLAKAEAKKLAELKKITKKKAKKNHRTSVKHSVTTEYGRMYARTSNDRKIGRK